MSNMLILTKKYCSTEFAVFSNIVIEVHLCFFWVTSNKGGGSGGKNLKNFELITIFKIYAECGPKIGTSGFLKCVNFGSSYCILARKTGRGSKMFIKCLKNIPGFVWNKSYGILQNEVTKNNANIEHCCAVAEILPVYRIKGSKMCHMKAIPKYPTFWVAYVSPVLLFQLRDASTRAYIYIPK